MAEFIEKQAAINAIDSALSRVFIVRVGESIVSKVPPADVRRVVRGRWERNEDDGHCYCTACGSVSPESDQNGNECDCPNFCPSCGADMRGGDADG